MLRRLLPPLTAAVLGLAGCQSETVFTPTDADRVTNGMTREQVTELMGGPPARVTDNGHTLIWEWQHNNAMQSNGYYAEFHLGPDGKTIGVPREGYFAALRKPGPVLNADMGQPTEGHGKAPK